MDFIPRKWHGKWVDSLGKTLEIVLSNSNQIVVSIRDNSGDFFDVDKLSDTGKSEKLESRIKTDSHQNPYLEIEAGIVSLGPTYHLYFLVEREDGSLRLANETDPVEMVVIQPNIGVGLYDDWEDDLGVTWALPLENYKKVL